MIRFALLFLCYLYSVNCWTTEDLELFDLVESTPKTFYEILGVAEDASNSEIRKAYRKLSTQYHPDKSTDPNAEEIFRQIAAVADVLRNDERRKAYNYVLKAGLPDWRTPIYYYRQLRNIGLLEISIFLFILLTFGQYIFLWVSYWEKKYEIEEVVLSKVRRKVKNQRKGKHNTGLEEEQIVSEVLASLPKPKYQDLFPIRLFYFTIHLIKSSPSYVVMCVEYLKSKKEEPESDSEDEEVQPKRIRVRKVVKPSIPDYTNIKEYVALTNGSQEPINVSHQNGSNPSAQKWNTASLTEHQKSEFNKALKKFPNGTLQRWEKVAAYLGCTVNEVVVMVKQKKDQQFVKGIPIAMQGVTGTEKENHGCELYEEKDGVGNPEKGSTRISNGVGDTSSQNGVSNDLTSDNSEKIWKQEEQQNLEIALKKYPKDTAARWERIAEFVSTKNKEECFERYKILVQQVKKKKAA